MLTIMHFITWCVLKLIKKFKQFIVQIFMKICSNMFLIQLYYIKRMWHMNQRPMVIKH